MLGNEQSPCRCLEKAELRIGCREASLHTFCCLTLVFVEGPHCCVLHFIDRLACIQPPCRSSSHADKKHSLWTQPYQKLTAILSNIALKLTGGICLTMTKYLTEAAEKNGCADTQLRGNCPSKSGRCGGWRGSAWRRGVLSPHMLVDLRPGNETGRRTVLPLPDWPLVPPC